MRLWSNSFRDGGLLSAAYAFADIDPASHIRLAGNCNPHLAWGEVPSGTESLALFCHDGDALADTAGVNRDDIRLRHGLRRSEFYHWILLDLPPVMQSLAAGMWSDGVSPRGKPAPVVRLTGPDGASHAMRQGLNDYTRWFAGHPTMAGHYYGYDGPCPPWNDERIHHYIFRLYALDEPRLALSDPIDGRSALAALAGHIVDEAQTVCAYSLNPALARTLKK